MAKSLLRKLVRNFSENGPKLLLENGANLRDLLTMLRDPHVHAIDFPAMTVERTHFVKPDYAHVAVDLLLKAPFHVDGGDPTQTIMIYLLVEHQSTPERFFILRLADYLLQAYKMQKRDWERKHGSDAELVFQPVLPIVLYTGERNWERIVPLVDLIVAGALFDDVIPAFKPRFLNLRDTSSETLEREGGFFGQVLRLVRDRHAEPAVFRQTLEEVITRLESMPDAERIRWVEFLSYIEALVYHARSESEQPKLRDVVDPDRPASSGVHENGPNHRGNVHRSGEREGPRRGSCRKVSHDLAPTTAQTIQESAAQSGKARCRRGEPARIEHLARQCDRCNETGGRWHSGRLTRIVAAMTGRGPSFPANAIIQSVPICPPAILGARKKRRRSLY